MTRFHVIFKFGLSNHTLNMFWKAFHAASHIIHSFISVWTNRLKKKCAIIIFRKINHNILFHGLIFVKFAIIRVFQHIFVTTNIDIFACRALINWTLVLNFSLLLLRNWAFIIFGLFLFLRRQTRLIKNKFAWLLLLCWSRWGFFVLICGYIFDKRRRWFTR